MATEQLTGSWQLQAFNTSTSSVDHSHTLAVPLQTVMPSDFSQAWDSMSADGASFSSLQLGNSLHQRKVVIKLEDEFESLITLLRNCIVDKETYDLRIDNGTTTDDTKIVKPTIEKWQEQFKKNEQFYKRFREIDYQMTVRKTDGTAFNIPELRGPDQAI